MDMISRGVEFGSLWFLATLYIITLFVLLLQKTGAMAGLIGWVTTHWALAALCAASAEIAAVLLYQHFASQRDLARHFGVKHVVVLSGVYVIYYLAGVILAQVAKWREMLAHSRGRVIRWVGFGMWVTWAVATYVYPACSGNVVFAALVAIGVCLWLMSVVTSTSFRLPIPGTSLLCSAALTVYLWHLPIIWMIDRFWQGLRVGHDACEFASLFAAALISSLFAHWLIGMSPWLRWMWLGEAWPGPSLACRFRRPVIQFGQRAIVRLS